MTAIYLRGHVDRERLTGDRKPGDPIWFVATTEGLKEDGLNLKMDRAHLDRYRANPVIGYGHNFFGRDNLPIGRANDISVEPPALRLKVNFDQADDFARTVEQKIVDGYINAMSVGFDAWGVDPQTGIPEGWELFEASIVPIPLDPDALAEAGREGIKDLETALARAREAFPNLEVVEPDEIAERVHQLASDLAEHEDITLAEAAERIRSWVTSVTAPKPEPAGTPRAKRAERRMRLAGDARA